jgi:hypothetical protein
MALGYAVFGVLLSALVAYLWLKARRLHEEIKTLEMLDRDEQ